MLRWKSCGQAWVALMRHVLDDASLAADDRGPVLEGEAVLFEISGFGPPDPVLERFGEPAKMELYARKFTQEAICPPFKYSYGGRLRSLQGVNQLAWVRGLLSAKPHSKSAWISLTVPGESTEAVPCLAAAAFRARGGALQMSAVFRSQNAYTAYLNYLPLRNVQAEVAGHLQLPCGSMRVYIDVPHVYVADAAEVKAILAAAGVPE